MANIVTNHLAVPTYNLDEISRNYIVPAVKLNFITKEAALSELRDQNLEELIETRMHTGLAHLIFKSTNELKKYKLFKNFLTFYAGCKSDVSHRNVCDVSHRKVCKALLKYDGPLYFWLWALGKEDKTKYQDANFKAITSLIDYAVADILQFDLISSSSKDVFNWRTLPEHTTLDVDVDVDEYVDEVKLIPNKCTDQLLISIPLYPDFNNLTKSLKILSKQLPNRSQKTYLNLCERLIAGRTSLNKRINDFKPLKPLPSDKCQQLHQIQGAIDSYKRKLFVIKSRILELECASGIGSSSTHESAIDNGTELGQKSELLEKISSYSSSLDSPYKENLLYICNELNTESEQYVKDALPVIYSLSSTYSLNCRNDALGDVILAGEAELKSLQEEYEALFSYLNQLSAELDKLKQEAMLSPLGII